MTIDSVEKFIKLLKKSPSGAVFNPWWQVDKQNDIGPNAPGIRRKQLRGYLCKRQGKAKLAMTSERILLGKKKEVVAALCERRKLRGNGGHRPPLQIIAGIKPRRTSKPKICPAGFSEPTATIVWSTLLKLDVRPEEFVLWNAFPWHSFNWRGGALSNRAPNKSEQAAGRRVLKVFLKLFPCKQVVALGRIAAGQLDNLGVDAHYV